ncbi:MAG: hypothetical protein JSS41_10540 [Proteobacteria bacterium]|nr:hypothetical protein [Pseudomonadota bacterium]
MSAPQNHDPGWIGVLDRVYGVALWLYPSAHRRRFGAQMRQALRDRCREAARDQQDLRRWLLAVALPDLFTSSLRERIATFVHPQPGTPMYQPATLVSAITLQVLGSALLALSAIGLGYAVISGRFAYPGTLDSLTALQVMSGVTGGVLLTVGVRQFTRPTDARRA